MKVLYHSKGKNYDEDFLHAIILQETMFDSTGKHVGFPFRKNAKPDRFIGYAGGSPLRTPSHSNPKPVYL